MVPRGYKRAVGRPKTNCMRTMKDSKRDEMTVSAAGADYAPTGAKRDDVTTW